MVRASETELKALRPENIECSVLYMRKQCCLCVCFREKEAESVVETER